jgi:hypothetical protein
MVAIATVASSPSPESRSPRSSRQASKQAHGELDAFFSLCLCLFNRPLRLTYASVCGGNKAQWNEGGQQWSELKQGDSKPPKASDAAHSRFNDSLFVNGNVAMFHVYFMAGLGIVGWRLGEGT